MIPVTLCAEGYGELGRILGRAFAQAARAKGAERHAAGEDFPDQDSPRITRARGLGYPLGQADKKSLEAARMVERGQDCAAVAELLGAINYLAIAILEIERVGLASRSRVAAILPVQAARAAGAGPGGDLWPVNGHESTAPRALGAENRLSEEKSGG